MQSSSFEPKQADKLRLQGVVQGILAVWDKADVVCLGEDHARKNDSDLRIALIENPDFLRRVNVIKKERPTVYNLDEQGNRVCALCARENRLAALLSKNQKE